MKKRQGFVSNSSSSSFIIVLPKVPKNKKDVKEMLFYGKDGGLSVYDMDGLSFDQISELVYNDVKRINPSNEDIEGLVNVFSSRYHYSPNDGHCHIFGLRSDEFGGQWYNESEEFWGTDQKLLFELRDFVIEETEKERVRREKLFRLDKKYCDKHPKPSYAYKSGNNPNTGKPYTKEEFEAYDTWSNTFEEFKKTNKEYQELSDENMDIARAKWKKEDELRNKVARKDVKAFVKKYKDQFIYLLSYGDEQGSVGCIMEHGNIFKNINHIRISNH